MALLSLPSAVVLGDAATHAQLRKERDAVLAQIVSLEESKVASGVGDEAAILAAKVALYSFRRDAGATKEEKLKQQLLVVGLCEQRLAVSKEHAKTGVVGSVEVLKATDAFLAAKQLLEELKGE
ncbi:MAG TPA: hypothetical protein PKJ41_21400 [Bryobacteraceae bacterium]|nr:hypothetical protein [Bryobacteraceae bacterium]